MTEYRKNEALQMIRNGYLVCAIEPGEKGPHTPGWQNNPLRESDCYSLHPKTGFGIICGKGKVPICALDFDITDPEIAEEAERRAVALCKQLAGAPRRVGREPKFALLCRAEKEGWRKTTSDKYAKDGHEAQLEVLGLNNELNAFHIHPGTGKPYEWDFFAGSPADLPAEKLPLITAEERDALIRMVDGLMREKEWPRKSAGTAPSSAESEDSSWAICPAVPLPDITLDNAAIIIRAIRPNLGTGTRAYWLNYGMALHHQFDGSPEALALWDEVSREFGPEAYKEGECEKQWNSFRTAEELAREGRHCTTFRFILNEHELACGGLSQRFDETGLAERVLMHYGDKMCRIPPLNQWLRFDEKSNRWIATSDDSAFRSIVRTVIMKHLEDEQRYAVGDRKVKVAEFYVKVLKNQSSFIDRVMRILKAVPQFDTDPNCFDRMHGFFLANNGLVELKTGNLIENRPEFKLRRFSPVNYEPYAKCPTFEKAVDQIFYGNKEIIRFLQKLVGAALDGDVTDSRLAVFKGLGANGKTFMMEIFIAVFGGYAERIDESTIIGRNGLASGGTCRSDLAKLSGARLVCCAETTEGGRLREADVKRMTGGDGFACRAPFGKSEATIMPSWRMVIGTNHNPVIKGDDDGVWRRLALLDFPRNFEKDSTVKCNPHLLDECKKELPGILNWLIEGWRAYHRDGLVVPEEVQKEVNSYREEMDDVGSWFRMTYVYDPDKPPKDYLWGTDLYREYRSYMRSVQEPDMLPQSQFNRRMGALFRTGGIQANHAGMACWRRALGKWRLYGYKPVEKNTATEDFPDLSGA